MLLQEISLVARRIDNQQASILQKKQPTGYFII